MFNPKTPDDPLNPVAILRTPKPCRFKMNKSPFTLLKFNSSPRAHPWSLWWLGRRSGFLWGMVSPRIRISTPHVGKYLSTLQGLGCEKNPMAVSENNTPLSFHLAPLSRYHSHGSVTGPRSSVLSVSGRTCLFSLEPRVHGPRWRIVAVGWRIAQLHIESLTSKKTYLTV